MNVLSTRIAANLGGIRERMTQACERVGRSPEDVQLVAVTKYAQLEWVNALVGLGVEQLGESRPQQLAERAQILGDGISWHLIGHLQRNKVRSILPIVDLIHSVDSLRLARRISEIAGELLLNARLLLEVNVSGEHSKDGFPPEDLRSDWEMLCQLPHITIAGLMTMAPASEDVEESRPCFRQLRELRDQLQSSAPLPIAPNELSMGMSHDFEVAVEEGATLVRIGSSLFEGLT